MTTVPPEQLVTDDVKLTSLLLELKILKQLDDNVPMLDEVTLTATSVVFGISKAIAGPVMFIITLSTTITERVPLVMLEVDGAAAVVAICTPYPPRTLQLTI